MSRGFSLLECIIAVALSVGIGGSVFQLFRQNESAFQDQMIVMEMQQAARMAAFQITDEIRLAGQGSPIFAATFDNAPSEDKAVVLAGSDASTIRFRAGLSNAEAQVTNPLPVVLAQGISSGLTVTDATRFNGYAGRHIYLWGPIAGAGWGWTRAILGAWMQVTPLSSIQFVGAPTMSLDEAVAIYRDGSSIRRTTATDMGSSLSPIWAPANELAMNVTGLRFDYYDPSGNSLVPDSLLSRSSIRKVIVSMRVQASQDLSNGTRPEFSLEMTSILRNLH